MQAKQYYRQTPKTKRPNRLKKILTNTFSSCKLWRILSKEKPHKFSKQETISKYRIICSSHAVSIWLLWLLPLMLPRQVGWCRGGRYLHLVDSLRWALGQAMVESAFATRDKFATGWKSRLGFAVCGEYAHTLLWWVRQLKRASKENFLMQMLLLLLLGDKW